MDLPVQNRRIPPEPPLEEIPRKHDGISVRTIFALGKRASDNRMYPQQRKQVPARAGRAHQFRQLSPLPCQVELPPAPRSHVFKAVGLRTPVVVVSRSNGVVVELLRIHAGITEMLVDHHQLARIIKGKRPQQNRTHYREQ